METHLHEGVQIDLSSAQNGMLARLLHFCDCQWIALVDLPQTLNLPKYTPSSFFLRYSAIAFIHLGDASSRELGGRASVS